MVITDEQGQTFDSGLVMYPGGHARNTTADLKGILNHKWEALGRLASDDPKPLIKQISNVEKKNAAAVGAIYDFAIVDRGTFE
jgi:2-methylcitrate dehydratase